jgi:hypothetical protein
LNTDHSSLFSVHLLLLRENVLDYPMYVE